MGSLFFSREVLGSGEIPNLDYTKRTVVPVAHSILLLSFLLDMWSYLTLVNLFSFLLKLAILNKTSKKDTSNTPKQLSHRLNLVEKDVETMKTGLARMGGDIDKVNSQINSEGFEIGEVQTSVQKLTSKVKRLEVSEVW